MSFFSASTIAFGVVASVFGVACGVFGSEDPETPPPTPSGSTSGGTSGAPSPPPPPPLDGTPKDDKITEQFGVFVSSTGAANAEGTRKDPLNSVVAAIAKAKAASKYVYICSGTFSESLTIESGISIVAGFDCSSPIWAKADKRVRIESPTSPAMIAIGISAPTRIEGLDVVAPNGTVAAPTSIGLHAKQSPAITIAKSSIVSGKGQDGASGVEPVQLTLDVNLAKGKDGLDQAPIPALVNPNGRRPGPAGGIGVCSGAAGFNGSAGGAGGSGGNSQRQAGAWVPYLIPSTGGVPAGIGGGNGADGLSGVVGAFTADGFTPADGTKGTDGQPGYGGQGGNGQAAIIGGAVDGEYWYAPTGGGGGAGGCPGLAGTPGKGGGASVGALLVESAMKFDEGTEVRAGNGGNGGTGTFGSNPTPGGAGGSAAGAGSQGIAGGKSGISGNGAGGPSVAIAHKGAAPTLTGNAVAKVGVPGPAVPQATGPDGVKVRAASAAGEAKEILSF